MSNLFLDHQTSAEVLRELETARVQVRRAIRYLTKAESPRGRAAHGDAHDAEKTLERAISLLKR
jgi:hypothetical protein